MIDLDENHSVASADEVRAIRPMFIPAPVPAGEIVSGKPSLIDPERCMVLIGGGWVQIERGVDAVRRALRQTR